MNILSFLKETGIILVVVFLGALIFIWWFLKNMFILKTTMLSLSLILNLRIFTLELKGSIRFQSLSGSQNFLMIIATRTIYRHRNLILINFLISLLIIAFILVGYLGLIIKLWPAWVLQLIFKIFFIWPIHYLTFIFWQNFWILLFPEYLLIRTCII